LTRIWGLLMEGEALGWVLLKQECGLKAAWVAVLTQAAAQVGHRPPPNEAVLGWRALGQGHDPPAALQQDRE